MPPEILGAALLGVLHPVNTPRRKRPIDRFKWTLPCGHSDGPALDPTGSGLFRNPMLRRIEHQVHPNNQIPNMLLTTKNSRH